MDCVILTPVSNLQDLKPVLDMGVSSHFILEGAWMCFNQTCGYINLTEGIRDVRLTGNSVHLDSKECPGCGEKLRFITYKISVKKFGSFHIPKLGSNLYSFLTHVNSEGSLVEG